MCGVAFFVLVGMVAFSGPASRFTRVLSWGPLSHLGDVSYGIYLWHEPVHHALYNAGLLSTNYVVDFLELSMCSVALATGTYYLVEKPALRIKNRWVASSRAAPPDGRPPASKSVAV
jgi:peptidoglycan/LPS O-acetylase OafA/YrhL